MACQSCAFTYSMNVLLLFDTRHGVKNDARHSTEYSMLGKSYVISGIFLTPFWRQKAEVLPQAVVSSYTTEGSFAEFGQLIACMR